MKKNKFLLSNVSGIIVFSFLFLFSCSDNSIYRFSYKNFYTKNQLSSPVFRITEGDEYGILVYDNNKNNILYSKNSQKNFIPASVSKLFVAVYALDVLGAEYQFSTQIFHDGDIDNGILKGNLYVLGGADPSFHYSDMAMLIEKIHHSGIQEITGRFFYIDDVIEPVANITDSMKKTRYYNTSFSGLNYNSNLQSVSRPYYGKNIYLIPPNGQTTIHWKNTGSVYADIKYKIEDKKWNWYVTGRYNPEVEFNLPVPDSGHFFAWNFYQMANMRGIKLSSPERMTYQQYEEIKNNLDFITEDKSLPLYQLLKILLTFSNNMWAETIMTITAHTQNSEIRKHEDASSKMKQYFIQKFPDAKFEKSIFKNGSGLTSANKISPFQVLTLLIYAQEKYSYKKMENFSFENMLAASGGSGTLQSRFSEENFIYLNRAKTGTLAYAIGLAGYLYSDKKNPMVYVIFKQNPDERKKYERNVSKASDRYEWMMNSQEDIDRQLARWAEEY